MNRNAEKTSFSVTLWQEETQTWLRYSNPIELRQTNDLNEVIPILEYLEEKTSEGYFALGFLSYEAALAFDDVLVTHQPGSFPLLYFGLFGPPSEVDRPIVESKGIKSLNWVASVTKEEYSISFKEIKEGIRNGDTYQVNYTYRLNCDFTGEALDLFASLLEDQVAPFAAFMETENWAICSVSPELFFKLDGQYLESKPMKGTARRGLFSKEDLALRATLRSSEKEQAENVMIVDMIRNDMSKIAVNNSVEVESLYDIEQYPTVWQMTSKVACKTEASTVEILKAMFPCASITGAPKRSTMEIIKRVESGPRNIYTGSIGYIGPERQTQFNVAIRTVLVDKQKGRAEYGIGGGIVWDSVVDNEYNESVLKSKVLNRGLPSFQLLETMLVEKEKGIVLLSYHLSRLASSASFFGFDFDLEKLKNDLSRFKSIEDDSLKLRLLYNRDGSFEIQEHELVGDLGFASEIGFSAKPIDSTNVFLYHKTTRREVYKEALDSKGKDVILFNFKGEITESCFANIAVESEGQFWTPPISSGLLGGCLRAKLLDEKVLKERVISIDELTHRGELYLMNAVRGIQKVSLR